MIQLLKKLAAGVCFTIGLPLVLYCAAELASDTATPEDKEGATVVLLMLGLPATGLGTWFVLDLRHKSQQQHEQFDLAREQLFLSLLQQHDGRLTITEFAIAAEISIEEAKEYLDLKATQLNAGFEVSNDSGIIYKFLI